MAATAESLDPSPCAQGTSATSASELNIRILNEPPYEIRRYIETESTRKIIWRVVMAQNLCIWSYRLEEIKLPKKPPKENLRKDFPVATAKFRVRSTVGRP